MENPEDWQPDMDALVASPEHHTLLLDNEHVRVVQTLIPPGERTAIHTHCWSGSLYILSWTDFIRYDADGNQLFDSRTLSPRPERGTTNWSPPLGPHYVHNIGTEPLHVIATELKTIR